MVYVKWAFWITFWVIVAAFFHYTLPQRDTVRIVNTYEENINLDDWTRIFWSEPDDSSGVRDSRYVQFIQAVRPNGKPIVYRNEDTGWNWPPYFKFDTANLYTDANDAISTKADPEWVSIKHYGWRNEFLTIFPNAISIKPVPGPDYWRFPWVNTIILTLFFAFVWAIWARWRRFRARRIDPMLDDIDARWDAAGDAYVDRRSRFKRWRDTWRSR
ncbi:DUF1523 family protein [Roseovarius sp. SCSIO 43702]|uniref:DUF1523 family protein n=1 Tax=Roseovarius sp. SCSIO 43702 TaxID=2823043 RepID=UPI001C73293C|nr:DUF1523 family protein [Roseovarius sp. SCSIO 43702]QYX57891.1 DUF1523 family protein [Roseovarius sp. SCSIO 43702]